MKKISISILVAVILVLSLLCFSSCYPPNGPMERIGPNEKGSLVVFFSKGVSYEQISEFDNEVIGIPDGKGGSSSLPGMDWVVLIVHQDYKGKSITFKQNASAEQRDFVKQRVRQSPIVFRVYEDVAANQVTDLP